MRVSRRLARTYAICAAASLVGAAVSVSFIPGADHAGREGDFNWVAGIIAVFCVFFALAFGLAAADAWFRTPRGSNRPELRGFEPISRGEQGGSDPSTHGDHADCN